jgi:hypothetical protein
MKKYGLVLVLSMAPVAAAVAASCTVTTTGSCPVGNECVTVVTPTTREPAVGETVGIPLAASEIDKYNISLNGKQIYSGDSPLFNYAIPVGGQLQTTDVWSATVTDKYGTSKPFTCTQPKAIIGPKSPPAAPGGLGMGTA